LRAGPVVVNATDYNAEPVMSVFNINAYNSRRQRKSVRPVELITLKEESG
jgi:hypothetical protein